MKNELSLKDILIIVIGSVVLSVGLNVFIVPLGLYNGGILGVSQLISTFLADFKIIRVDFELTGIVNLMLNLPLFLMAYRSLSKRFLLGSIISTLTQTVALSFIPIPSTPILADALSACIIGGFLGGVGAGLVLTTRTSAGGVHILGVYCSLKFKDFSVGRLSIMLDAMTYSVCALYFNLPVALYSIIYAIIYSMITDKVHLQNIEVSLMIFTHHTEIKQMIMSEFVRGVTYWKGQGAYTNHETEVLVTVVSKYEVEKVQRRVRELDPKAFVIVNEGLKVSGGYEKRLV